MNGNLILTKESVPSDIERYFRGVLALDQQDKVFPVNLDDVWRLVYAEKGKAVRTLKSDFIENVDFIVIAQNGKNPDGGRPTDDYYLTSACLEYFVARKVRPVFEVYRRVFHHVANNGHQQPQLPATYLDALKALVASEEQKQQLAIEIETKGAQINELNTAINEMQPKANYVDSILQCNDTVTVTGIAQDYGYSAKAFNMLLSNMKIQHKVGKQWIIYGKYLKEGYVQSETFTYTRADGTTAANLNTKWTQKGRLFLYETLKKHNILPLIEQSQQKDNLK